MPTTFVFAENAEKAEKNITVAVDLLDPGFTPDSPIYFLKTWKESIQTFFTFGAENKAKQFLHLAEVRLAEYQKMVEKGKIEIAEKTLEKYEKQLSRALDKVQELKKKGKDVATLTNLISEKTTKHQEVLKEVLQKVPDEAKKEKPESEAIEEKPKQEEKKIPQIQPPAQPKSTRSIQSKSVPAPDTSLPWVTGTLRTEFPSIVLTGQPIMMGLSGGSAMPQPVAEQRPVLQPMSDDQWCAKKRMRVDDYGVKYILEMLGVKTVKVGSVDCRACHIRKFSEDGVFVAERWDDMYFWYLQKLSGKWACEKSVNYKNFIGSEWTDYYHISESWSPQNFYYQCVKREGAYVSGNADYCEKDVPATAILPLPTPAPTPTEIRYYTCPDGTKVESGKLACPKPTPTEPPDYISCTKGGTKNYVCPGGTAISWQCECLNIVPEATAYSTWKCLLQPIRFCPASTVSVPLTIIEIEIRLHTGAKSPSIFWTTNVPTLSYIEHGPTVSYGFRDNVSSDTPKENFVLWGLTQNGTSIESKLQPNTVYHFRIVAEDTNGNKFVSQDYTFTAGL